MNESVLILSVVRNTYFHPQVGNNYRWCETSRSPRLSWLSMLSIICSLSNRFSQFPLSTIFKIVYWWRFRFRRGLFPALSIETFRSLRKVSLRLQPNKRTRKHKTIWELWTILCVYKVPRRTFKHVTILLVINWYVFAVRIHTLQVISIEFLGKIY